MVRRNMTWESKANVKKKFKKEGARMDIVD